MEILHNLPWYKTQYCILTCQFPKSNQCFNYDKMQMGSEDQSVPGLQRTGEAGKSYTPVSLTQAHARSWR